MLLELLTEDGKISRYIDSRNSALRINENITNDKELFEIIGILDKEIENMILTDNTDGLEKTQIFVENKLNLLKERKVLIMQLKNSQISEKGNHPAINIEGELQNSRNIYFFQSLLARVKKAHEFVLVKKLYDRGEINPLYQSLFSTIINSKNNKEWRWLIFERFEGAFIHITNDFGQGYGIYYEATIDGFKVLGLSDKIYIDEEQLSKGESGKMVLRIEVDISGEVLNDFLNYKGKELDIFVGIEGLASIKHYRTIDAEVNYNKQVDIEGGEKSKQHYNQKGDYIRIEFEEGEIDYPNVILEINERFEDYYSV